jgi:hypothetical protein
MRHKQVSRFHSHCICGGALVVSLVVVAAAVLIALKPHFLLRIPLIGFVPYLLITGIVPPYFTYDAFKADEFETWIRPNDVVVSVGVKMGTNWMLYLNHLIRVKGHTGEGRHCSLSVQSRLWLFCLTLKGGVILALLGYWSE